MRKLCNKCKYYRRDNFFKISGFDFVNMCNAGEYYFIESRPDDFPSSKLLEGKIVYTDVHLKHFLKRKIICPQKHETLLKVIYPLIISTIAIILSLISFFNSK